MTVAQIIRLTVQNRNSYILSPLKTYLWKAFESDVVSSKGVEQLFFSNNNTKDSSKQARIPPTTLAVMAAGNDSSKSSKTPKIAPAEITRSTMRFAAYKQTYRKYRFTVFEHGNFVWKTYQTIPPPPPQLRP